MSTTNTAPFGSKAWHDHNAAEVASRPVTNTERKPLTPDQIDTFRPVPAIAGFNAPEDLYKILGPGAGLPRPAAQHLTRIIWELTERIAYLEFAEKFRIAPHQRSTDQRTT
jgi:hypothetical protein